MVNVGDTAALISYVNSEAPAYGLDPAAVLATAHVEGWGGTIGDGGHAYGPWQDHLTDFSGRPWFGYGTNNSQVQTWAWSTEGINYALNQMATTGKAKGLTGYQAVVNINTFYERSADIPGQIKKAWENWYQSFANGSAHGTDGSVSTVDPSLATGAELVSGQSASSQAAGTIAGNFKLLDTPWGPIQLGGPAGTLLSRVTSTGFWWAVGFFVLAGLLIAIGIYLTFQRQINQTVVSAGKAAAIAA